jgi:hypothetical protein
MKAFFCDIHLVTRKDSSDKGEINKYKKKNSRVTQGAGWQNDLFPKLLKGQDLSSRRDRESHNDFWNYLGNYRINKGVKTEKTSANQAFSGLMSRYTRKPAGGHSFGCSSEIKTDQIQ